MTKDSSDNKSHTRPKFSDLKKMLSQWLTKLLLGIALALIVLVSLLPLAIEYTLEHWLSKEVNHQVSISNVDLNIFSLEATIDELALTGEDKLEKITIDLLSQPLLNKKAEFTSVDISGLELVIKQKETHTELAGFSFDEQKESIADPIGKDELSQPWMWGLHDAVIKDTQITLVSQQHTLHVEIDEFLLQQLHSDRKNSAARVKFIGKVAGANVVIDGHFKALGKEIFFEGKSEIDKLSIKRLSPWVGELPIQDALLSLDSQLLFKQNTNNSRITQQGRLTVEELAYQDKKITAQIETLTWQGDIDLSLGDSSKAVIKGDIDANTAHLDLGDKSFEIKLGQLNSKFNSNIDLNNFTESFVYNGELDFDRLAIDSPNQEISWLDMANFSSSGIVVEGLDKISIEAITLNNYAIGRQLQIEPQLKSDVEIALLKTEKTELSSLNISQLSAIEIASAEHTELHSRIERQQDGTFRMVGLFSLMATLTENLKEQIEEKSTETQDNQQIDGNKRSNDSKDDNKSTERNVESQVAQSSVESNMDNGASDTPTAPVRIRIRKFSALANSSLTFVDYAVKPIYKTKLVVDEFNWHNFDTQAEEAGKVKLSGTLDDFTKLSISSDIMIQNDAFDFTSVMDIQSLALPPISSYSVTSAGYALNTGQLDGTITLKSHNSTLEGEIDLTIKKLAISKSDIERISKGKQNGGALSLEMALDLLRDSDDNISLTIPIEGDINNPDFDIQQVINKAVASAATSGAMTYLTAALQPYGALITIAKYAGDASTRIRLEPVDFNQGKVEITQADQHYLTKVSTVLKEREKLQVKICGIATEADRMALGDAEFMKLKAKNSTLKREDIKVADEVLRSLAKERAQLVRGELINSYQIDVGRLINCLPALDDKVKGLPRVELLL